MKLAKRLMRNHAGGTTQLCINASGEDGSTVIVDETGKIVTRYGDVQVDTSLGYPTILFNGYQDNYLKINDINGLAFGADNFTLDFVLQKIGNNNPNTSRLWNCNGDFYDGLEIQIGTVGELRCYMSFNGSSWDVANANIATLSNNTEYAIRFARDGGTMRCAINGTSYTLSTSLGSTPLYNNGRPRTIGGQEASPWRAYYGHLRGVRAIKGIALPISDPLTLPFFVL